MHVTGKIERLVRLGMPAAEACTFVNDLLMQGIAIGELQRRDAEQCEHKTVTELVRERA